MTAGELCVCTAVFISFNMSRILGKLEFEEFNTVLDGIEPQIEAS